MPKIVPIYSENATYQQIETLKHNRNKRLKQQAFLIEGVRHINQARSYNWTIKGYLYSKDKTLSSWAQDILNSSTAETHYQLPLALLEKLSNKNETPELIAMLEMPSNDINRIKLSAIPLIVIIDRSSNPGNLGTIIRSCDALGVDGLIMTGHAVDLYSPETIAATTGSFFSLPTLRLESHKQVQEILESIRADYGDLQIVATSAQAKEQIQSCNFWRPTVLLIGNETDGLSRAYEEMADTLVGIAMQGSASSLNVACATSILLYEVGRQRNSV